MQVDLATFHKLVEQFEQAIAAGGVGESDRYNLFLDYDPFVSVPPALLNAGHVASYATALGMVSPFEKERLVKPATYLVEVEGECRYRDENDNIVKFYLSKDPSKRSEHLDVRDVIRLAPNSVCFLTLAPEFRMPAYIGARFNLLIRDVYRGLLVGTGPLVDPGFRGRLSIPIHNFTNKEYFIEAGEGLVYFEFTKLSWTNPLDRNTPSWLPSPIDDQPPFPASKANRKSLDDYLNIATGGGPPASSIGLTMKAMENEVKAARRLLGIYSIGGVVAAAALVLTAWSLYASAQQFALGAQTDLRDEHGKLGEELEKLKIEQSKQIRDGNQVDISIPREPVITVKPVVKVENNQISPTSAEPR